MIIDMLHITRQGIYAGIAGICMLKQAKCAGKLKKSFLYTD